MTMTTTYDARHSAPKTRSRKGGLVLAGVGMGAVAVPMVASIATAGNASAAPVSDVSQAASGSNVGPKLAQTSVSHAVKAAYTASYSTSDHTSLGAPVKAPAAVKRYAATGSAAMPKHVSVAKAASLAPTAKTSFVATSRKAAKSGSSSVASASASSSSSSSGSATPVSGGSNLKAAIRFCESGNNYSVVNSIGAGGAYQFLLSTWHGLGYSGLPQDASAATQDAAFDKLYAQAGTSPWVSSEGCWSKLVGSNSIPSATTGGDGSTVSTSAAGGVSGTSAVSLNSVGFPDMPYSDADLSASEKATIEQLTNFQKQQSWWNADAAAGNTVTRHITGSSGLILYTHNAANFTSPQVGSLPIDSDITGKYVNTDWFQITSGDHAGEYVSTGALELNDGAEVNGQMSPSQLAEVPSDLRAFIGAHNQYMNPSALKQFIRMSAAYRHDTGSNLTIAESYRDLATQEQYAATDNGLAANPGDSNHGLGLAVDLNGVGGFGSAEHAWIVKWGSAFGFQNPAAVTSKGEYWHIDFGG